MRSASFAILIFFTASALAHQGHDTLPNEAGNTGPITLSESAIKNLEIATKPATLEKLGKAIDLNASVEFLPERYAILSAPGNGKITSFLVKLGEAVVKGQGVAIFQAQFGNSAVTLSSPIAGNIIKFNAGLGQGTTRETNIMEIADASTVLVRGDAYSLGDIEALKIGQQVRFLPSGETSVLTGTVQRLSKSLDAERRTYAVYALVQNPKRNLLANITGRLSVQLDEGLETLTVPARAVLGELGDYFLFVREGDTFERRAVKIGQKRGDRVEILDGVLPDEEVVTVGNYQLQYAKPAAPAKDDHASEPAGHNDDGHTH